VSNCQTSWPSEVGASVGRGGGSGVRSAELTAASAAASAATKQYAVATACFGQLFDPIRDLIARQESLLEPFARACPLTANVLYLENLGRSGGQFFLRRTPDLDGVDRWLLYFTDLQREI